MANLTSVSRHVTINLHGISIILRVDYIPPVSLGVPSVPDVHTRPKRSWTWSRLVDYN